MPDDHGSDFALLCHVHEVGALATVRHDRVLVPAGHGTTDVCNEVDEGVVIHQYVAKRSVKDRDTAVEEGRVLQYHAPDKQGHVL